MILSFEMLEGPSPLQVPLLPVRSMDWLKRMVEELYLVSDVRTIALMRNQHVIAVYDGKWMESLEPYRRIGS